MNVIPFRAEHFWALEPQAAQAHVRGYVTPDSIAALEGESSLTAMAGDRPMCCFGWFPTYPTKAVMWAILSKDIGPHLLSMTRIARSVLSSLPYKRMEMDVACEFEQGHRWARMLGFTLEAERLRHYRIDGGDSALYARIQA